MGNSNTSAPKYTGRSTIPQYAPGIATYGSSVRANQNQTFTPTTARENFINSNNLVNSQSCSPAVNSKSVNNANRSAENPRNSGRNSVLEQSSIRNNNQPAESSGSVNRPTTKSYETSLNNKPSSIDPLKSSKNSSLTKETIIQKNTQVTNSSVLESSTVKSISDSKNLPENPRKSGKNPVFQQTSIQNNNQPAESSGSVNRSSTKSYETSFNNKPSSIDPLKSSTNSSLPIDNIIQKNLMAMSSISQSSTVKSISDSKNLPENPGSSSMQAVNQLYPTLPIGLKNQKEPDKSPIIPSQVFRKKENKNKQLCSDAEKIRSSGSDFPSERSYQPSSSKNVTSVVDSIVDVLECPICMEHMEPPIYMCKIGHDVCGKCIENMGLRICPLCRAQISERRNFALEVISQASNPGKPCANASYGCLEMVSSENAASHSLECNFNYYQCPLYGYAMGIPTKLCSWQGKKEDIWPHFQEKHDGCTKLKFGQTVIFVNLNLAKDDHNMQLLNFNDNLFLYHVKIDVSKRVGLWTVQYIGPKDEAEYWSYEFVFYIPHMTKRMLHFNEECSSSMIAINDIFDSGKCVAIPLVLLQNFIFGDENKLNFKFFIRRHDKNVSDINLSKQKQKKWKKR